MFDMLPSAASLEINISLALYLLILILYPSHHLLSCPQIWSKAIHTRTNVALLDKFHGVLSRDSLQLRLRQLPGVDPDPTFGSTKRYVRYRQLEGHQAS